MTEAIVNHLWQSTWLALAAAVLTLVFRRNAASVRFRIWAIASLQFLIPLSVLVHLGSHLRGERLQLLTAFPDVPFGLQQIMQPGAAFAQRATALSFTDAMAHWPVNGWTLAGAVWLAGAAVLACYRTLQWLTLRSVAAVARPLHLGGPLPVRETATVIEPGIFGVLSPVLLLPAGIGRRLTAQQLQAILAHELCHWQRKDNLVAALHVLVEILFWFHPLVWWLGNRMIIERERAVDQAVLLAGGDRESYAEGILRVCRLYVEPPPMCAAGVSGGTLRQRIEEIMTLPLLPKLHVAQQGVLLVAGLAVITGPVALGYAQVPAQTNGAPGFTPDAVEMRSYSSTEWNFSLDVPKAWKTLPAVPSNSQYELVRFASQDNGIHLLIVFRMPNDERSTLDEKVDAARKGLAELGFGNFVKGERTVGGKHVVTLDFDQPRGGGTWSCRTYFIGDGRFLYSLGFGTTRRDAMFPLYDAMAKTFGVRPANDRD